MKLNLFHKFYRLTKEKKLEIAYIDINLKRPLSKLKQLFVDDKELFDKIENYYRYYNGKNINYISFETNNSFDELLKIISKKDDNIVAELKKVKGNKWVYIELFNINFRNKNYDLVEYYNEQALTIDKKFLPALINKAYLFLNEKKDCKEIIKILKYTTPFYQEPYLINLLGNAYINCSQPKKALKAFQSSFELKKDAKVLFEIAKLYHYRLFNYRKGFHYYQETLKLSNETGFIQELGLLYLDMGESNKTESLYKTRINSEHTIQDDYNLLIKLYIIMLQLDNAQFYLDKSIEKFGENYQNEFYNKMITGTRMMMKKEISFIDWDESYFDKLDNNQLVWVNQEFDAINSRMPRIWKKFF